MLGSFTAPNEEHPESFRPNAPFLLELFQKNRFLASDGEILIFLSLYLRNRGELGQTPTLLLTRTPRLNNPPMGGHQPSWLGDREKKKVFGRIRGGGVTLLAGRSRGLQSPVEPSVQRKKNLGEKDFGHQLKIDRLTSEKKEYSHEVLRLKLSFAKKWVPTEFG